MYSGVWLAFVAVVLLLDWGNARPHHVITALLAFPGALVGLAWAYKGGRWVYAASVMTAAILVAYLAWWAIEIARLRAIDPSDSLWDDVWLHVKVHLTLPGVYLSRSKYLDAALMLYWITLMPVLQAAFVPFLLRSLRFRADAA
jgi:hypothetical protein